MTNSMRIDEIQKEIRKIEMEQEEAESCIKKLGKDEEDTCEELRNYLSEVRHEFEVWHGDPIMTTLIEEKHSLLLKAERDCGDFINSLCESQKQIGNKCEADIETLRQELQRLEMM